MQIFRYFKKLSKNELELIINSFKTEKFQKGDTIFNQGEDGDKLYILISGELECWKTIKKVIPKHLLNYIMRGISLAN